MAESNPHKENAKLNTENANLVTKWWGLESSACSVTSCARWACGGCPLMAVVRPVGCHLGGRGGCYLGVGGEAWDAGEFGTGLVCLFATGPRALALGADVLHWDCPTSLCLPPSWRCYYWGAAQCSGLGYGCCHGAGGAGHLTCSPLWTH